MKNFYNQMVNYFADNLVVAALVACLSILVIFVLLAVLVTEAFHSKKKAQAKKAQPKPLDAQTKPAQQNTTAPSVTEEVAEEVVEEAPIEEPAEEVVEEAPSEEPTEEVVEEAPSEEPTEEVVEEAPIEEPAEEVVEEAPSEEPAEEVVEEAPIEEPAEEVVEEAPIEEPAEEVVEEAPIEEPAEEVVEEAPIEEPAEEVVEEASIEEEIAVAETVVTPAATTLHDELKDVNTDIDFYEEDAADQEARYKGKWVICRLVTEDKSEEEMYFFELHASNGEKLLTSEEYTSYNGAVRGIQTHKNNILKGNFRITMSKRGEYIFKLLSGKNMLLCLGEGYATKARCEAAIASAKRFAETAILDENVQYQVVKVPVEDDTPIAPLKEGCKGKWVIDCTDSPDGEKVYTFELFANNGERLLSSEEYTTYVGAVNGIQTHKANIEKGNFRIVLTKHGDYIYKLLNSNGQLLCLGEHYKNKRLCQNAVESVRRFATNSPVLANPNIKK